MWGWWLYSHVCYSPTRALSWLKHCCLPVFNYPSAHSLSCAGASTAVALWQARANQEAHPKLKQIKCILSDQLFFFAWLFKALSWPRESGWEEGRTALFIFYCSLLCSRSECWNEGQVIKVSQRIGLHSWDFLVSFITFNFFYILFGSMC